VGSCDPPESRRVVTAWAISATAFLFIAGIVAGFI
jgi:hypothetical protein